MAKLHCRIGSLEKMGEFKAGIFGLHCRIGSLEIITKTICIYFLLHCRIGSLEINLYAVELDILSSLPNRQLRKY